MDEILNKRIVTFIVLHAMDMFTTGFGFRVGLEEANPIANWMCASYPWLVLYKITGVSIALLVVLILEDKQIRWPTQLVNLIMLVVVIGNILAVALALTAHLF